MAADSGASSHFIDNQLLYGIEQKMPNYVVLDPPVTIIVAGNHRLSEIGQGVFVVIVVDRLGAEHSVQLLVTIVPGLGRHLFSGGAAPATKGVNMVISKKSYLGFG